MSASSSLNSRVVAALRPFYFAVHPDRFGATPEAQAQNERSLQIFNGYLYELLTSNKYPNSATVQFFITCKDGKQLRKIDIQLKEQNPLSLIRNTLQSCGLPTNSLSKFSDGTYLHSSFAVDEQKIPADANGLSCKKRVIKKTVSSQTKPLIEFLQRYRDSAISAAAKYKRICKSINQEIDDLKVKTGLTDVVWSVTWQIPHMRRNLVALKRLIETPSEETDRISAALNKHMLRQVLMILELLILLFGRGSYLCTDGNVQFGVDDVPDNWKNVCLEAQIRRSQIPAFNDLKLNVSKAFGYAYFIVEKDRPLLQIMKRLETLYLRISVRNDEDQHAITDLSQGLWFEVMPPFEEITYSKKGIVYLPCAIDFNRLRKFLEENHEKLCSLIGLFREKEKVVEVRRMDCIRRLKLVDLTWQEGVDYDKLETSLNGLLQLRDASSSLLEGLSLHFGLNSAIQVMEDGKISLPAS